MLNGIRASIARVLVPKTIQYRNRIWDSALFNRLNKNRWARTSSEPINTHISGSLAEIRKRCRFEAQNNAFVQGVIQTHINDIVGDKGPRLQVQSGASDYVTKLEDGWRRFWEKPEITGQLSGVDLLELAVRQLWTSGEYLYQLTNAEPETLRAERDAFRRRITLRINPIEPSRLDNPVGKADPLRSNVYMGIERTDKGTPIKYWIQNEQIGEFSIGLSQYEPIDAANIIHGFKRHEAGQARGIPWLTSSLESIAALRDYDAEVLEAARMAALFAVYLFTQDPDQQFIDVNDSEEIERGMISTCPPGWEPKTVQGNQPSTTYADYRAERMRELGRPISMPLMMVRVDSSGHNYSSARFDGQLYQRGVTNIRAWFSRSILNRILNTLEHDMQIRGILPSARPDDLRVLWLWSPAPHVDPLKEANADAVRLQNHMITLSDVAQANGRDLDELITALKDEKEKLAAAGLSANNGESNNGENDIESIVESLLEEKANE